MKVGDYIRTDRGKIGQYIKEVQDYIELEFNHSWCDLIFKNRIIKTSPRIIDLIRVGDYVNGYKVLEICEGNFEINNPLNVKTLKLEFVKEDINPNIPFFKRYNFILNEDIKSIVTKEQFEQMEYKIEIKVN